MSALRWQVLDLSSLQADQYIRVPAANGYLYLRALPPSTGSVGGEDPSNQRDIHAYDDTYICIHVQT